MSSVADRHTGRLGNRLADFGSHQPVSVTVAAADHVANRREAQHTTWMLLNLLARAEGVIASITLDCPESVLLRPQVVPHLTNSGQPRAGEPFRDAIIRGANAIGVIPVTAVAMSADDATGSCRHIAVTDAPADARDLAVYGRGWRAALHHAQSPVPHAISGSGHLRGDGAGDAVLQWALLLASDESLVPFGPYLAACLAAGDVYLAVRMPAGHYEPARTYGWDCWTASPLTSGIASTGSKSSQMGEPGPEVSSVDLSGFALAGVGAVGAAWMHALWACPGVHGDVPVVDADRDGVTVDNLNRGVLFTRADVGQPKAAAAAAAAPGAVKWSPSQGLFESSGHAPDVLVSAVDGNIARAALQNRYRPSTLSGSTRDLRAESLRIFPGSGACLRCHNAARRELSDEQARAAALAEDGGTLLRAAAEAIELDPAELAAKLRRRDCDAMSERALTRLRELSGADVPEFSVGFVSVAAGVLLASETVKAYLGATVTGKMNRDGFADHEPTSVAFQFWRPHAATNGACHLGRDPQCPACDPDMPAFAVWHGRWQQWRDERT
jgi:ThiF family